MSSIIKPIFIGMFIGSVITIGAYSFLAADNNQDQAGSNVEETKPLYWVAPMDANYRRDKPGKSPMGMDLVPVYDDGQETDAGKGTIRISPDVINNLGVRTSPAHNQTLDTKIKTVGYIAYDEDKLIHIHPRVQGWVEKLYVTAIGDEVESGQPLYDIYSPELVNAQEELLLALNRKNASLIAAAENRLIALQLPSSAIFTLKETKKVQQTITFYAPQSGVVENLKIREGYFVKPGSTLMAIGDLSHVWIEAEIFERQAAQVKVGNPVYMTLDYLPGQQWQGNVDYIYPTLDAQTRTVKVRLRFANEDGLFKPNMFAQITIDTGDEQRTLLIPKEALIRTGEQDRVVLALGEGRFKSIEVNIGRFDSKNVEILSGLNQGDQVVSSAQFLLDSESSKSSDFKRMSHEHDQATNAGSQQRVSSATVSGTINSLMIDHGMINISRSAIEKWNRPAAVVDFITAKGVSLKGLEQGMEVEFTFEVHDGTFVIVKISPLNKYPVSTFEVENVDTDHSNH
jgi:membrane fusion protein, copper/silver efflux system